MSLLQHPATLYLDPFHRTIVTPLPNTIPRRKCLSPICSLLRHRHVHPPSVSISSRLPAYLCVSHRPYLLLARVPLIHRWPRRFGSKVLEKMAPRRSISLATLRTRASDNETVYSAQVGDADDSVLAEHLHHRLSCLPPVDTGKHAYLFLLACFVLSALVWSE